MFNSPHGVNVNMSSRWLETVFFSHTVKHLPIDWLLQNASDLKAFSVGSLVFGRATQWSITYVRHLSDDLSVYLSVCHTRHLRLNGFRYRNTFCRAR